VAPPVPATEARSDDEILALLQTPSLSLDRLVGDGAHAERDLAALLRAGNFTTVERPALSTNKKWEWLRRALTGRLAGFDPHN
jgi:hypothetical protein